MIIYFSRDIEVISDMECLIEYQTKLIKIRQWCYENLLSEWSFVYDSLGRTSLSVGIDIPDVEEQVLFKLKFNI